MISTTGTLKVRREEEQVFSPSAKKYQDSLIASSLAILSSIGGCVLNNFITAPPLKG